MHDVVNVGVTVHRSAMMGTLLVKATSSSKRIVHFRSYDHNRRGRKNDFNKVNS